MVRLVLKIVVLSGMGFLLHTVTLNAQILEVYPVEGEPVFARAIEKAAPGDTLRLNAGIYKESDLLIDKPLTVTGREGAVIDGENKGFVLTVRAENVNLSHFEIRNSGRGFMNDYAGLLIDKSRNITIENMTLTDNFFAVYLAESAGVRITNNMITASGTRESSSGNGVHLWYSKDVYITGNTVTGHRDGYYFEFVEHVEVVRNISHNNLRYGLHFMFSKNNSYSHNEFSENGAGVAVMYTSNVVMENNTFKDNWGASTYGLLLKEIDESFINGNTFSNNSVGLYMEASGRNKIDNNTFTQNGWAVRLMANSMDNEFTNNNFIANTFEVATNSRHNFNHFEANYWSQYEGYDLDRDGFGDVPHRPVRLFAVVVQKHPQALILLRSTLIGLLDATEKFLPVLTPDKLIDEKPRMKEVQ